jgi:hypothetical protein
MVWSIGIRSYGFRRKVPENEMMRPGEIYEFEHQTSGQITAGHERAFLLYVKQELESKNPYLKVNYAQYGSSVLLQAYLSPPQTSTLQVPWWAPIVKDVAKWITIALAAWAISSLIYNIYLLVSAFGPEGASAIGSIIGLVIVLLFMSFIMNFFMGLFKPMMPKREEEKEKG